MRAVGRVEQPCMSLRPSAAYGPKLVFDDLDAILDSVVAFPDDAGVVLVKQADNPWGAGYPGLALTVHGASILLPVIGAWPLGGGEGHPPIDLALIGPQDLVPALRAISKTYQGVRRNSQSSFTEANASMDEIVSFALAFWQSTDPAVANQFDQGEGEFLCEIGMADDGSPLIWIENGDDVHLIDLPPQSSDMLVVNQPLLLLAHERADYEIKGIGKPTVLLSALNSDDNGTSMEAQMPSPIDILRIIAAWSPKK